MNKNIPHSHIILKRSSIHNIGVFAKEDIPKGTKVIEYVGERITKAEANRRGEILLRKYKHSKRNGHVYIFTLNKRYDLDGNVPYNPAKYINHSCSPNCEAVNIRGHIWIIAKRDIKKGEEITYDYGYDLQDFEDHRCYCGSPNCPGYIVGRRFRWRLKQILKDRQKISLGKNRKSCAN